MQMVRGPIETSSREILALAGSKQIFIDAQSLETVLLSPLHERATLACRCSHLLSLLLWDQLSHAIATCVVWCIPRMQNMHCSHKAHH
jgi:hypothetical protein